MAPGQAPSGSAGVAILRVERLTGSGAPDKLGNWLVGEGRMELRWSREESDETYVFLAAQDGAQADFYLALPPGHYRFMFTTAQQFWERTYLLRFGLGPGETKCVGTIRFQHDYFPDYPWHGHSVTLRDDCEASIARFRAAHPEFAKQVTTSLFEKYVADDRRHLWVPEAWGWGGWDGSP